MTDATRLTLPMEKQPPCPDDCYEYTGDENGDGHHYWRCRWEYDRWWRFKAPYRPGDRIPEGTVVSCVPVRGDEGWGWEVEVRA